MSATDPSSGYRPRRRPRWWLVALIVLGHLLALFGLSSLLAPKFTSQAIERATSFVTVTVTAPPEPSMQPTETPTPEPEGGAGEEGKEATPREVVAPPVPVPRPTPAPRASASGTANSAGAMEEGAGTGTGGEGDGTGAGRGGSGRGGFAVTRPSVRSGSIDSARDFPIPEGGRRIREGTSVVVQFTVGVDGRAFDCRVTTPGPDPATNALVCPLVVERIRFNPARDANGQPVPARYGWRQDFFRR